jgi:nucleoside-diphosphate-sugar epimerase
VVQGNLSDESSLRTAVKGQDAIVSTLGPTGVSGYNSFSAYHAVFPTFYKLLLRLMREFGVRRILAMSTFSLYDPKDKTMISRAALVWLVWLLARGAWREFVELGDIFQNEGHDIEWTLYRVGMITDAPESATKAGFVGEEGFRMVISRNDMATWLVEQAATRSPQWVGQAPAISSLGKEKV